MDDFFSLQFLMNCTGRLVRKEKVLKDKEVYVYFFSSSTCGPGNELLPKLKIIYDEAKKRRSSMEIIYISSDTDSSVMLKHFIDQHHGWYAIPINEIAITELQLQYNITHEPQIIVVRNDGAIVSRKGKNDLMELGINVIVKWLVPYII